MTFLTQLVVVSSGRLITLVQDYCNQAYEAALANEINKAGLGVRTQVMLPMIYETIKVDNG